MVDGFESSGGFDHIAEVVEDLVASAEQRCGSLGFGAAGRCMCGGEVVVVVVVGAFDRDAGPLLAGFGGSQVRRPGQVGVEHGGQGVGGFPVIGGGDEQQFGVRWLRRARRTTAVGWGRGGRRRR